MFATGLVVDPDDNFLAFIVIPATIQAGITTWIASALRLELDLRLVCLWVVLPPRWVGSKATPNSKRLDRCREDADRGLDVLRVAFDGDRATDEAPPSHVHRDWGRKRR